MLPRRLVLVFLLLLAACAAPSPRGGNRTVFVIERGWHTDIGLPVAQLTGPLASLAQATPGAQYLTFGFGERQYLINRNPGLALTMSALLPSRSALLATALLAPPEQAFGRNNVVALNVPQDVQARIEQYVQASFAQDEAWPPSPLAEGPYPGSTFYPGQPTYSGIFTCNTWSADALAAGGLITTGSGILFSGQVMALARAAGRNLSLDHPGRVSAGKE